MESGGICQPCWPKQRNIASYENGATEPKIYSLLKMSELFQVSIKELVFEDLSKGLQRENTILPATLPDIENFLFRAKELEAVFKGLHLLYV